uniref:prephenate dehydratase n=1 Tax=Paulinella chromatophora TaxID=39717 RepID=B1X4W3_PAUCH|nr:Prephenate dehydratase [Paulinella chromatophora]ACB42982.1 Prephenate dehydratase [Paulinella chromatophora]
MATRIAFLGPVGTYGEQAAQRLTFVDKIPNRKKNIELVPQKTIRTVIQTLLDESCSGGIVPVENSVEGGVTGSLDALWQNPALSIKKSLTLPVRHALLSDGSLSSISEILSHPQALAQCSDWLSCHLPNALQLSTNSTAEAARMAIGSSFRAAIASKKIGYELKLKQLAYPINDISGNCTRFFLLEKGQRSWSEPFGSMAFSLRDNSPGALLKALSCFAFHRINMTRIESRPSRREMGEYIFFLDLDFYNTKKLALRQVVEDLLPLCKHLIMFGTYQNIDLC